VNLRTFQRRLLQRPGITRLPVCPACGQERAASDITLDGICRLCAAERAADYEAYLHADLRPDGTPKSAPARDEIVDDGRDFE
jgi:hypothetical protein